MSAQATMTAPGMPVALRAPTPLAASIITVEQYFALERAAEIRYEYVEREMIPIAGESLAHNRIALNFSFLLDEAFADGVCTLTMEGVRLRVSLTKYRYPDVVALRGEPVTDGENPPALLNPFVIVEILAPSILTQTTDRGEKLDEYRHIAGLTD